MRQVKFNLSDSEDKMFTKLVSSASFYGDTPKTLLVKLMMRELSVAYQESTKPFQRAQTAVEETVCEEPLESEVNGDHAAYEAALAEWRLEKALAEV